MADNHQQKPGSVAVYQNSREMLTDPRMEKRLEAVAPAHMDAKRMMRVAMSALAKNPTLAKCSPISVGKALIEAAECGLEVNGWEGHLVPYWNGKQKVYEAQFIPDYKGLVKLSYQSDMVVSITAEVVRAGDLFLWEKGTTQYLTWRPSGSFDTRALAMEQRAGLVPGNAEELCFVWAMAELKGGGKPFVVLTRDEVMKHKAKSQAADSSFSPWNDSLGEPEMWKKTALRLLCKTLPRSSALNRALVAEMAAEMAANAHTPMAPPSLIPQSMGDVIEGLLTSDPTANNQPPETTQQPPSEQPVNQQQPAKTMTEPKTEPKTEPATAAKPKKTRQKGTPVSANDLFGDAIAEPSKPSFYQVCVGRLKKATTLEEFDAIWRSICSDPRTNQELNQSHSEMLNTDYQAIRRPLEEAAESDVQGDTTDEAPA